MAQLGTKKSLTLAAAKEIGNAAEAKARELNFTNSIAVVDDGGNLIYQVTMDGTQTGSINVAVQKALAALRFKRSTKLFQDMVTGDKPHMAFLPGAVPVEGRAAAVRRRADLRCHRRQRNAVRQGRHRGAGGRRPRCEPAVTAGLKPCATDDDGRAEALRYRSRSAGL